MVKPRQSSLKNLVMWENYFLLSNKQNKDVSPTDNACRLDFKNLTYSYSSGTRSSCGLHVHKKAMGTYREKVTTVSWGKQFPTPCEPSNPLHADSYLNDKKKCWDSTTFRARWDLNAVSTGQHWDQNHLLWSPELSLNSFEEFLFRVRINSDAWKTLSNSMQNQNKL